LVLVLLIFPALFAARYLGLGFGPALARRLSFSCAGEAAPRHFYAPVVAEVLHRFGSSRLALLSFTCPGGVHRQESTRFFYPYPVQARACFLSGGLNIYFSTRAVIRVLAGACRRLVLESPDQIFEFSGFSLYSCDGFSVTHTRCLMKCA
jgi:hypothetical protein